jgi:hypothetical protein
MFVTSILIGCVLNAWNMAASFSKDEPTISIGSCWDGATSTDMVVIKDGKKMLIVGFFR